VISPAIATDTFDHAKEDALKAALAAHVPTEPGAAS